MEDKDRFLFLSYNSSDRKTVDAIQGFLQSKGFNTFLDHLNLSPGMPWFDALQVNITKSYAVVVFIGPGGLGVWQKREMALALDKQAKDERSGRSWPVIPVLLPGTDVEKTPGFLLLNTFIDLRRGIGDPTALAKLEQAVNGKTLETGVSSVVVCPYRALRVFREEDAPLFFGREVFSSALVEKVGIQKFIAVVGPSGSGKSSVVQAGLFPLLRLKRPSDDTWDIILFTPGRNPFESLAVALVHSWDDNTTAVDDLIEAGKLGKGLANKDVSLTSAVDHCLKKSSGTDRLLIVIDQFEELFTLTSADDRKLFLEVLLETLVLSPITVVVTLRADYYSQAISTNRHLSDLIQEGIVNLGPMKREELQRAIEDPARRVGVSLEAGLADRILDQVEAQPGYLPLVEFALTELWERRAGGMLTHEQYKAIGEVEGAISRRAETLFTKLPSEQQETLSSILTRLVRVSAANEEGTDTRQRLEITDLDETARSVVQEFVKARLLVVSRNEAAGKEIVEVAHESLIRNWSRLGDLLDKNREFLLWRQNLNVRINDWKLLKGDKGALLSGFLLAEARQYLRQRKHELNETEQKFISESDIVAKKPRLMGRILIVALGITGLIVLIYWIYTKTDRYQIREILQKAPDLVNSSEASTVYRWMSLEVFAGHLPEAWPLADSVKDESLKAVAFAGIAGALFDLDMTVMGDSAINKALVASGGEKFALLLIAQSLTKANRVADAEKIIDSINNDAFAIYEDYKIPELLAMKGDMHEAELIITKLTSKFESDRSDYHYRLSGVLAEAGMFQQALEVTREIPENGGQNSSYIRLMGCLKQKNEIDKARDVCAEALDSARHYEKKVSGPFALTQLTGVLVTLGDTVKANTIIDSVLARLSSEKDTLELNYQLVNIAGAMINANRIPAANMIAAGVRAELDNHIFKMRHPQASAILFNLAKIYARSGKIQEAVDMALRHSNIGVEPGKLASIIDLVDSNRTQEVLTVVQGLSQKRIDAREVFLVEIVRLLVKKGDFSLAGKIAKKEINEYKDRTQAYAYLARGLSENGSFKMALDYANSISYSDDRLSAYSVMLMEYLRRTRPELRIKLESLKEE